MGGVVVDGDYAVGSQLFHAPNMIGPGGIPPPHSYVTSSGDPSVAPDSSPPGNSVYGGKSSGRKRSRKKIKVSENQKSLSQLESYLCDSTFPPSICSCHVL